MEQQSNMFFFYFLLPFDKSLIKDHHALWLQLIYPVATWLKWRSAGLPDSMF